MQIKLSECNFQNDLIAEYLLCKIYKNTKYKLSKYIDNNREIEIDITKDQIKKIQICSVCHSEVIKNSYECPKGDICKDEDGYIWIVDGYSLI